jgi:predicted RNA-binding protein with PUA domain
MCVLSIKSPLALASAAQTNLQANRVASIRDTERNDADVVLVAVGGRMSGIARLQDRRR